MRKNLLNKRRKIEAIVNTISETNSNSMFQMYNYIIEKLADSNYQGAITFLDEHISKDFRDDNKPEDFNNDIENLLYQKFQTVEEKEKAIDSISRVLRGEISQYREVNIPQFKATLNKLLRKKGLLKKEVKRYFMPDEWSRLTNNGEYSQDKLYRLMYAMELTPDEACELAAASSHPIRLIKTREMILFACIIEEIYDYEDVNEVLCSFGEKELSGTVLRF